MKGGLFGIGKSKDKQIQQKAKKMINNQKTKLGAVTEQTFKNTQNALDSNQIKKIINQKQKEHKNWLQTEEGKRYSKMLENAEKARAVEKIPLTLLSPDGTPLAP